MTAMLTDLLTHAPWTTAPDSFAVDLLQFCSTDKRVIRSKMRSGYGSPRDSLQAWATRFDLFILFDEDGYFFVADDASDAVHARDLDRSNHPHECEFGDLLGYPPCCYKSVASVGEENIDALATLQLAWEFDGQFQLIDTKSYTSGQSLICHLPCTPNCKPSLDLALAALTCLQLMQPHDRVFLTTV